PLRTRHCETLSRAPRKSVAHHPAISREGRSLFQGRDSEVALLRIAKALSLDGERKRPRWLVDGEFCAKRAAAPNRSRRPQSKASGSGLRETEQAKRVLFDQRYGDRADLECAFDPLRATDAALAHLSGLKSESDWPDQHEVGCFRATATACGIAPLMNPRHSTAPLGFPGSAMTSEASTTAARLRERIALGVILIDSARITSPKPGNSTRMIARIASGVISRGPIPVPPVVRINPQPCLEKERMLS